MRLQGVRQAVDGDLFPEYAAPVDIAALPGTGDRDSEHCALKWGSRSNNPLPSTGVGTVSDPYRQLRQGLGSSLEASMPTAVRRFSIFYGYPAEVIAEWCGVSLHTARLYKKGTRKASRAVLRLFTLHRDGRVLGACWKGWKVSHGVVYDPDGNGTSVNQLRNYFFVMQLAAALAARDPQTQADFHALLKKG